MADKLHAITPSTGVPLTQTHAEPMVRPGSKVVGRDGHDHVYVRNSTAASIAAATAVTITEPAFTIAAGAGGFTTNVAIPAGEYGWVRKTAL